MALTPEERAREVARLLLRGRDLLLAQLCPACRAACRIGTPSAEVPCMAGTCPDLTDDQREYLARCDEQRRWEERQARLKARI
jgi:hypothetical protein